MVAEFRKTDQDTPVGFDGIFESHRNHGLRGFCQCRAQRADIDGVLTVDLPPEEAGQLCGLA